MIRARLIILIAVSLGAQDRGALDQLEFLVGDWVGEGSGQPGQGAGGTSVHWDLNHKILVRKNFADYPAANGRPAVSHQDLMTIYPEAGGLRAIYFDNEGHVIHYAVTDSASGTEFLSDLQPGAPRYRLTYKKSGSGLKISFDIAPPGKADEFKTYTEGTLRRK
jgi:hypothetical protein